MPLSALLGGEAPAYLQGHGWITAEQARHIAADAELTRLVCDPVSGQVLDVGRTRYRPPGNLADLVRARDVTCVMPGCLQSAEDCDLDHVITAKRDPRTGKPTAGGTDRGNLSPDCRHHHLAKDGFGWSVTRDPDGSYTWTSPLHRQYTRDPVDQLGNPEYLPDAGRPAGAADEPVREPDPPDSIDQPDEVDEEYWEERTWREALESSARRLQRERREQAERDRRRVDDEPPPF